MCKQGEFRRSVLENNGFLFLCTLASSKMISRATTLALVAMVAQSTAQPAWDGSTKPRMEAAAGDHRPYPL